MQDPIDYRSPTTDPPRPRRTLAQWCILLAIWSIGLFVWALYFIAAAYVIIRIL